MPWALLTRLLSRLALAWVIRRGFRSRYGSSTVPDGSGVTGQLLRHAGQAANAARLAGLMLSAVSAAGFGLVFAIGSGTAFALGPVWLGEVLGVLALVMFGLAARAGVTLARDLRRERWS